MTNTNSVKNYLTKNTESASLAVFRIFFGLLMFVSILRFWLNGWIEQLYIKPNFFFSYYGFDFVKPLGEYTYALFFVCGLASLFVMLGFKYRWSIIVLFISFTYIELMDKSNYLNHYYFVSLSSFVLCLLPANVTFSIDAYYKPFLRKQFIPKFTVDAVKLLLSIVYFYAGLAKLNSDWLFRASPLNIWLSVKTNFFLIGDLMNQTWFHYAMSWGGMLYDLLIPFLLIYKRTRMLAFLTVVFFHIFTRILFPIGMFPFIMIVSTIIFFDPKIHHKILNFISKIFRINKEVFYNNQTISKLPYQKITIMVFSLFFLVQLVFPFRYLLYSSELFWSEEGYRFSWRVMLVEKAGYADFKVVNKDTGKIFHIDNTHYLEPHQEKQMSFQSDFILQYAHYLGDKFKQRGIKNPSVYVDNYVTLNGRLSTRFVKENVDLYQIKESLSQKTWIEKFNHPIKIKGL